MYVFIIGGLVVAVAVISWVVYSGGSFGPDQTDITIETPAAAPDEAPAAAPDIELAPAT